MNGTQAMVSGPQTPYAHGHGSGLVSGFEIDGERGDGIEQHKHRTR